MAAYFKLSVPVGLAERFEAVRVRRPELGYRSRSEAMMDVLRRGLEALEAAPSSPPKSTAPPPRRGPAKHK